MSQDTIAEILRDLGGRAKQRQIRDEARRRFPKLTLHGYVGELLRSMEKWGRVRKAEGDDGDILWILIEEKKGGNGS